MSGRWGGGEETGRERARGWSGGLGGKRTWGGVSPCPFSYSLGLGGCRRSPAEFQDIKANFGCPFCSRDVLRGRERAGQLRESSSSSSRDWLPISLLSDPPSSRPLVPPPSAPSSLLHPAPRELGGGGGGGGTAFQDYGVPE